MSSVQGSASAGRSRLVFAAASSSCAQLAAAGLGGGAAPPAARRASFSAWLVAWRSANSALSWTHEPGGGGQEAHRAGGTVGGSFGERLAPPRLAPQAARRASPLCPPLCPPRLLRLWLHAIYLEGPPGEGVSRHKREERRQLQLPRLHQLHAQVHAAGARPHHAPAHLRAGGGQQHRGPVVPTVLSSSDGCSVRHERPASQPRQSPLASMSSSSEMLLPRSWMASTDAVTSSGGRVAGSPSSLRGGRGGRRGGRG